MDSEQEFHDLSHEQLLQTGHQDLHASCQEYLRAPMQDHGQQVLADLQRMERLVYKHQGLQGDPPLIQANSGLIAQNLTSIAANDGNLCVLRQLSLQVLELVELLHHGTHSNVGQTSSGLQSLPLLSQTMLLDSNS